jgi:rhodanese-related sulfurtransferase
MTQIADESPAELTPLEVKALVDQRKILLVDVRETPEYAAERIHGAMLCPLSTLDASTLPADPSHPIVFQCGSGKRSMLAAQKHLASGARQVAHMTGGIGAWKASGLPVVRIDPATGRVLDSGKA